MPDSEQNPLVCMYLTGDAKLWWRIREEDDVQAGRTTSTSWKELKKELQEQFLLGNTAWVACTALKKLKHTGTIRDSVKEFSLLMLDICDMSEEDKLFNFLTGLQN